MSTYTPAGAARSPRKAAKPCACGCGRLVPPAAHKGVERKYATDACRTRASRERRGHRRKPAGEGRQRPPRHEVAMPDELWEWVGEQAAKEGKSRSWVVCMVIRLRTYADIFEDQARPSGAGRKEEA